MKRKLVSLLLASTMALSFVACGSSDAEVQEDAQQEVQEEIVEELTLDKVLYEINISIPDEETIAYEVYPSDMIEDLYGITTDMYENIMLRIPMISQVMDELIIIEAKEEHVDTILAAVEARKATLSDPAITFYPEQIEMAENAYIYSQDNLIVFASGLHADKAEAVLTGN